MLAFPEHAAVSFLYASRFYPPMDKRGLAIEVIILAALGIAVFVILFAILANRAGDLTQELSSCQSPAVCKGLYSESGTFTNGATAPTADACDPPFEPSINGEIQEGQPRGRSAEDLARCTICCARV